MIPTVQTAANVPRSRGFTAFPSMTIDGKLKVVTAIMKLKMVPSWAPLAKSASATGMVPKISAYMGTPTSTARTTPKGFPLPRAVSIHASGIQLWITAPIPTPARIYGNTFLKVDSTWSLA